MSAHREGELTECAARVIFRSRLQCTTEEMRLYLRCISQTRSAVTRSTKWVESMPMFKRLEHHSETSRII